MLPCNIIYYSKLYWRLNVFRAAYRSSSGAPNYLQPLVYIPMWWPAVVQAGQRPLTTTWVYKPQAANSLELLMMSGMPLETRWAFNKVWNNKFYYKVATCWLFLLIHSFVMSVRPSVWNNSVPTGRIFMIFGILMLIEKLSRKINVIKIVQEYAVLYMNVYVH